MSKTQKWFGAILTAACLAGFTGCIERKLTIGSDPSGALVSVNDEEVGRTPITIPFLWNGDYDVVLRVDKNIGTADKPIIQHYFLHTHKNTKIPAFELFGIDFFSELAPWPVVHEEVWAFQIPPVYKVPDDILMLRAEELKKELDQPEPLKKNGK